MNRAQREHLEEVYAKSAGLQMHLAAMLRPAVNENPTHQPDVASIERRIEDMRAVLIKVRAAATPP